VDDPTVRTAALFDALASTYDAVGVDFFQPISASLLAAMPPSAGERWLDVGCGRGAVLLPVAERVAPSGCVEGIDISPAMVDITNSLLRDAGVTRAHAHVGNAMTPDFAEDSFDAIASCLVLFFLPDPLAALRAWLPLLAPGGRLGVTTFGEIDERWRQLDDVLTPYLPPAMLDARASGTRGPFASDAGMEDLVRSAGFSEARTVVETIPVKFASAEKWYEFSWSTGQRMMWLAVPEDQRAGVKAEALERFAACATDEGSVVFTQQIRHTLACRSA
jgi:ubiquinone/menaquinone biosynthesis C-methylase UbiE